MRMTKSLLLTALIGMPFVVPMDVEANNLAFFATYNNVDLVSAGVGGLRSSFDTGTQTSGTITLSGVTGPVRKAFLYWHGPTDSANPAINATLFINGAMVTGTNIGFSQDNNWGFVNSQAYRADVTSLVTGNGRYVLTGFGSTIFHTSGGANTNGASLIVLFDDGNPGND